jgi:hypothetical protein
MTAQFTYQLEKETETIIFVGITDRSPMRRLRLQCKRCLHPRLIGHESGLPSF